MTDLSRRDQVQALLQTRLDWLLDNAPLGTSIRGGLSGEGGSVIDRPCPRCGGTGQSRVRGFDGPCDRCHGKGAVTIDAYTQRELAAAQEQLPIDQELEAHFARWEADLSTKGTIRHAEREQNHAALERLSHQLAQREEVEEPDWWIARAWRAKVAQYGRGSYHELDLALALLELVAPNRHRLVLRAELHDAAGLRLSDDLQARFEETLDWLAGRMPDRIRVPAGLSNGQNKDALWRQRRGVSGQQRRQRDDTIRYQAETLGWGAAKIASVHALDVSHIRRIIRSDAAVASAP